jgi:hypothetical protein
MSDKVIKQFENEMKDFQDRLGILETRMRGLEEIHQKLERLSNAVIEIFSVSISALDLDSSIRDFLFVTDRASIDTVRSLIGEYLKRMKRFAEEYDRLPWKGAVSDFMKRWTSLILMCASAKRIEFNDFCSILIKNLGSDLAKKTVALEDIVKFYGAENATTWKRLIK